MFLKCCTGNLFVMILVLAGLWLLPRVHSLHTVSQAQYVVYAVRSREEGETTAAVLEALSRHREALGAGKKGGKEEDGGKTEREFITTSHTCSDAGTEEYHVAILQPKVKCDISIHYI